MKSFIPDYWIITAYNLKSSKIFTAPCVGYQYYKEKINDKKIHSAINVTAPKQWSRLELIVGQFLWHYSYEHL